MSKVLPYQHLNLPKEQQIEKMFDTIAPQYDFLNHFLSGGIDIWWRKKAISLLAFRKPQSILDVATGTGDLLREAYQKIQPQSIIGLDLSKEMLILAEEKAKKFGIKNVQFIQGTCENLPFQDNTFEAVIVSFGVRNFENLEKGLAEIYRVLKPNGVSLILEFSKPKKGFFQKMYQFYLTTILPKIGKLVSKEDFAYQYLPESVERFPEGDDFLALYHQVGFKKTVCKRLTFGICSIYWGEKS